MSLYNSLQALSLSEEFNEGKLLACELLCKCMLRRHDLDIDESLLSRFYAALHTNLLHAEAVSDVNFFSTKFLLSLIGAHTLRTCAMLW